MKEKIRKLGMIGISKGNGHPYSFSAIFNGYNKVYMEQCPYRNIYHYLKKQNKRTMRLKGAIVTHLWTQNKKNSKKISRASKIKNIVKNYQNLIGQVDGVIIARDDPQSHFKIAKLFLDKKIPIFIDKPLTDNLKELGRFAKYYQTNLIMSCSAMRYAREIKEAKKNISKLGKIKVIYGIGPKDWTTYGVHLLEAIYGLLKIKVKYVQSIGRENENIVHLRTKDGKNIILQTSNEIQPLFQLILYGTRGYLLINLSDLFYMFKKTLSLFTKMIKTKKLPIKFSETAEIIRVIIAGNMSKKNGKIIKLDDLKY